MSLRDFAEHFSTVTPFIVTDFNLKPYWDFHNPPRDVNGDIIQWNFDTLSKVNLDIATQEIWVMTLKAWLTKTNIIMFDLSEDNFMENKNYLDA